LGYQVGDEEAGESPDVELVGLDLGGGDEADLVGVGDERGDDVVEGPGVGGSLDDDGVGGAEVFVGPVGEAVDVDTAEGEGDLHLSVEATDDQVVLVGVDGDEAIDLIGWVNHCTLL
jgi:hypothetical protein